MINGQKNYNDMLRKSDEREIIIKRFLNNIMVLPYNCEVIHNSISSFDLDIYEGRNQEICKIDIECSTNNFLIKNKNGKIIPKYFKNGKRNITIPIRKSSKNNNYYINFVSFYNNINISAKNKLSLKTLTYFNTFENIKKLPNISKMVSQSYDNRKGYKNEKFKVDFLDTQYKGFIGILSDSLRMLEEKIKIKCFKLKKERITDFLNGME